MHTQVLRFSLVSFFCCLIFSAGCYCSRLWSITHVTFPVCFLDAAASATHKLLNCFDFTARKHSLGPEGKVCVCCCLHAALCLKAESSVALLRTFCSSLLSPCDGFLIIHFIVVSAVIFNLVLVLSSA